MFFNVYLHTKKINIIFEFLIKLLVIIKLKHYSKKNNNFKYL